MKKGKKRKNGQFIIFETKKVIASTKVKMASCLSHFLVFFFCFCFLFFVFFIFGL